MQSALDILRERGFIAQITFEEDLDKAFREQKITFYTGFDLSLIHIYTAHFMRTVFLTERWAEPWDILWKRARFP